MRPTHRRANGPGAGVTGRTCLLGGQFLGERVLGHLVDAEGGQQLAQDVVRREAAGPSSSEWGRISLSMNARNASRTIRSSGDHSYTDHSSTLKREHVSLCRDCRRRR